MPHEALVNLHRIGQLKSESYDAREFDRLLKMARSRLTDAQIENLSNENRFMVFQCLAHTLGWPAHKWRILDAAHQKRNLAEYEGFWDIEESVIAEICSLLPELIADVQNLQTHT
jgi:hypothetical protein